MMLITIDGSAIAYNRDKKDLSEQLPIYSMTTMNGVEKSFQVRVKESKFPIDLSADPITGVSAGLWVMQNHCVEPIQDREDRTTKGFAIIHVNRSHISKNKKDGGRRPIFTLKIKGKTRYARAVHFREEVLLSYRQDKPLSCGARAWIEAPVDSFDMFDEMDYAQAITFTGDR